MTEFGTASHSQIIRALVLREMNTRFGREGLGFVWLVLEPLVFCFGVLVMWAVIKPPYEHGIRLAPFVMTGYMSLILLRHFVSSSTNALQANIGLLHHRQIRIVHVFGARAALEFLGTTAAFVVVYVVLLFLNEVDPPHSLLPVYAGWLVLAFVGHGFALIMAGLSIRFEAFERVVPVLSYALIPLSGCFLMVDWIPPQYREAFLYLPFPHGIEMIRDGVFGEFVATHYNTAYALACGAAMNIAGFLLIAGARDRIDVE